MWIVSGRMFEVYTERAVVAVRATGICDPVRHGLVRGVSCLRQVPRVIYLYRVYLKYLATPQERVLHFETNTEMYINICPESSEFLVN